MLEYKDENIVKSQDFWDLVENGFLILMRRIGCRRTRTRKVLFFIQQVAHKMVFSCIAATTISKQA